MTILFEQRPADSPYLISVTQGRTVGHGSSLRPAEMCWHLVFSRHEGQTHTVLAGPLSTAGVVHYGDGAEVLWIKFALGTFMPNLPPKVLRDKETELPKAAGSAFWLDSTTWPFPSFENVETFVARLVRQGVLVHDPLVEEVLQDRPADLSPRTLRHRFAQATGLSQRHIRQMHRAFQAQTLLEQGHSILDTVHEAGYYDQPHLTRSLRHFLGVTPAQLAR